ncbi:helix-turn-helix domain-containing protein [Labedella phragmitis]|uniref:helix-turn-helix domain-containing protein n=1 Tax=Labedella phragmitis TaxID=2498849 RepID=UPI003C7A7110
MRRTITEAEGRRAHELYDSGANFTDIARALGRDPATVKKVIGRPVTGTRLPIADPFQIRKQAPRQTLIVGLGPHDRSDANDLAAPRGPADRGAAQHLRARERPPDPLPVLGTACTGSRPLIDGVEPVPVLAHPVHQRGLGSQHVAHPRGKLLLRHELRRPVQPVDLPLLGR